MKANPILILLDQLGTLNNILSSLVPVSLLMSSPIKTQTGSFSKYQPARYFQARANFIPKVAQLLSLNCDFAKKNIAFGLTYNETLNPMQCFFDNFYKHIEKSSSSDVYSVYLRKVYKLVMEDNDEDAVLSLYEKMKYDYAAFLQYTSLKWNGNNIFEFADDLLELFQQTDIDDVFLEDIHLPFPTIYLHFGGILDKELYGNISTLVSMSHQQKTNLSFSLDGAYVSQCPITGSLLVMLTSLRNQENITNINNCVDSYEDILFFNFDADGENTTFKKIIDLQTQELRKQDEDFIEKQNGSYLSESDKNEVLTKGKLIINQRIDLKTYVLKLIVNCILYLQSYPEDIEEDDYTCNTYVKTRGFGKATLSSKIKPGF